MNNGNENVNKRTIKTFIFILILIILILLLIKGCPRLMNNKGIKIINIKQVVDSFDDDEIYIKNLKKNHRYIYDVTIHNYLDEDYYLYKVEINNKNVTHDEILKLLKHGKDTKVKLSIKSLENIKDKTRIKFYYGKLKEIYVEDEVLSVFGDEKVKLPMGPEKEGYKFLGYSDKKGSEKAKYKTDKEYNLKDGTRLYPVYEKINPKTGGDSNNNQPNNNNNQNNNNQNNNDDKKEEPKAKSKFIVTFDYQNGTKSTTKEVTNTEKYGTLPTAVKTGYYFVGWYLGNQKITSESIVDLTSNVTLKAKYNIINYSINYNLDGGSTTNPSTYTVESNDIILSDAQKDGVEFVGWTGSNGDTPEKNVTIPKGSTGNKEYNANYSAHSEVDYKVIHKQKQLDGSYNTVLEETFSAPYGTKVKPTVKTYEGFNSPEPQEITVKQDGSSEVEYKYERKEYKFTINDSEDVISSLPSGNYPYETEITLTAKEKEGYDFTSWSNGETTNPVTITLTENTTIRPKYTAKTYVVEFNANTGTGEMASQTFTYDEEKALNKNTFTKLGNKFIGWNTKADGTGTPYLDEAIVNNLATSGTVTLYAQFIVETYTISFNTDGGEELFSIERTYGEAYGDLPEAVKPGYTFTGWYLGEEKIESTTIVDVTSDTTLKARYNINNYNITYNLDGGSASNPSTYTVEDTITLNNPTKTGYTFSGWTGSNGESLQTLVTIQKGSTGDKTYTAHYSANPNTKYVVKHLKQKLTLDGYELEETENLYGASDTKVTPEIKSYTGFVSPKPKEITIKADGTTELEYKYDREMYTYTITNPDTMTSSLPSGEYPYGTEVTITANTVPGYTFSSWNNGEIDNPATFAIDENLNIAPIYNANTYYVVFNNNTGSGSMSDQQMTYDADEVLKKCTFTKVGYSFDGWNTKADGTGTNYADEATVKNLAESGNVILYAKWKANTDTSYKVITKKQNIDLETYTETENIYTGTTDTEVTPTVVDYTGFVSPTPQTITITGDGNASVTYTYLREMYEFNLPDTENVISSKEPGEYPYGTEIELTAKEKEGYTFDGWSDGVMDNPRTITLDDDTTIEPRYKANTDTSYTVKHYKQKVTLDGYDLADTDNLTGTTDTEVTPTVKTYEGFTSPSTQTVTIKGDGTTEVTYNYNRIMYSFNLPDTENVTSSHEPGNYPYGTEITISANDIPGYTFTEWSDGNTDNPRTISLSDDISLTPSYSANTNTTYKVEHYKQKVTLDGYDLADTDNLTGTTDTEVTPEVKTYEGFNSPDTQTVIIKGDGSTVVTYNYDRVMYTYTVNDSEHMTSSLPSGDYPYGTEVTVTANTVPGYTFGGWNDGNTDNPRTITIDKNISIEPTYTANTNTSYKVEHYKQKVTLDGYNLAETDNLTGTTDTKVTPNVKTYTGFDSPVPTEVTIKGDGTTVVTYNYTRKSYTFTLNDSEDVISSHQSGSYPYETQITLTANAKPGYTFIGWSNGNTNQTITISLTDNIEISPVYSNNTDTAYTVIHKQMNIDGDGYTTYETELLHGTTGSKVTPSVKTYTGFTSPSPEEITIKADGSATLTYKYSRNKYDFAVSDRTYIDEDHSTKNGKYYYQTEISVTATNRTGYTFAGWSNGDNTLTTTFNLDDDTTITPSYTANKYNVVFNSNTGSGSMSDQEMTYDKKANLTKNTFEKTGYLFAGWNIKPDGTGATYEDEAEVKNLATSGNVILYAQWFANPNTPYKVIHRKQNLDMESYTDIEENYTAATNQEITPEVHTYTGFVSPQAQTTTVSADGTTVVTYVYNRAMYTFTLNDKNDVVSSHEDGSYPYETVITLRAKTKEGYTFIKWSDDVTTNPRELTLTGNTTISPIYSEEAEIKYTVIHRKQNLDMETYTDIEEEYQGAAGAEVTPAVKSYTGFNSPEPETVTINADGSTVLTYVYTRKMYEFTISDTTDVTSSHVSGEYPYETEITLTANTKPGYTFIDWSTGETSNPLIITLSSNVEIYPIYSANTDTEYKVIHRKQNLTLDGYDIEEEITNQGTTDTEVTPAVKSYTGFTSPSTQTVTINGDGSTVVTYDYNRISYTLTYEDSTYIDFDRSTPEGSYPYGTLLNIKAVDRAGYTFDGWSNGQSSDPLVIELSKNVSIKPLYVANTNTYYKIIHRKQNLNLTTYTDEIEERFGTTDTEVTPNVKTYEGFDSPQTQTTTISGDGSTTIIYEYTRKMYTLSFNNNENVITSTPAGSYPYDTEITIKAEKRVGNTFDGWTNGVKDVTYTFRLRNDLTIEPLYISSKYTVSFNANGGTGIMSDQEIYKNIRTKLKPNEFTKTNNIFAKWNTEPDGSGTDYSDSDEIDRDTDIELYAIWIPSDKVARIGNTYYTKLATAISNVPTTGVETEVVLLKDTAEKIEIANTKNVVLNLQNNTLSNNGNLNVIVNNGKLKLMNGTITTDVAQGAINNNSTGTMVIDGTHIIVSKTTSKQAIYNDGGNLTINGDTYLSSESNIRATLHNLNNGTITINSGTIISTEIYAIYNEKGSLTIGEKDGKISDTNPEIRGYSYGVVANSKFDFYDGIIEGRSYHIGKTSNTGNTPSISNDTGETKINEIETDATKITGTKSINNTTYKTLTLSIPDTPEPTPHGPVIYTIKFDAQGGHTSELKRSVEKDQEIGTLPTVSREGYITKGWFTEKTGGDEVTAETIATRSTTYYAQYISTIDQAIFSPSRIAMHIGDFRNITVTKPTAIEEYTFESNDENVATVTSAGRVTGVGEGITTITITGNISGITKTIDVEIVPPVKYRVKFNANGGTASEEERFVSKGVIGELPSASKDDLVFNGWYTGILDGVLITSSYYVDKDVELFARYSPRVTMFAPGIEFNEKIKALSGEEGKYNYSNTTIKSIKKSTTQPDISLMTEDNIVSSEDSKSLIYAWFDDDTIYWWSSDNDVYLNPDCSYMYSNLQSLEELELDKYNSSRMENMTGMFSYLKSIGSIDFSELDTSNVENMTYMFLYTKVPTLDFSSSNLEKVETMYGMFISAEINTIDFSNINTKSLTNMSAMFSTTKIEELDLSDFDTSHVTDFSSLFGGTSSLKRLDISNWDFSSITSLNGFFSTSVTNLEEIKMENVNTSTITNMASMFSGCSSLKEIDLSSFDTSNVTTMSGMFGGCSSLRKVDLSGIDTSSLTTMSGIFGSCSNLEVIDFSGIDFSFIQSSAFTNNMGLNGNKSLKKIILDNAVLPSNMSNGFQSLPNIETISFKNVDTSHVTNMSYMFQNLNSLAELDLSSFDTSNVTNMNYMFYYCISLNYLDLSSFNTENVTNMGGMFYYDYNLLEIDLSSFDTSNVTATYSMFYNLYSLKTIYASDSFDIDGLSNSSSMFNNTNELVGGMGTKYTSSYSNYVYAHVDGGVSKPGYFTNGSISTYSIRFDANGGESSYDSKKIVAGTPVGKLPTATKNNKMFKGWFTGVTEGTEIDESVIPNSNTTYYAHWGEAITEFDIGTTVNQKFKRLSGSPSAYSSTTNNNIINILRSETQPDISNMTEANIVSSSRSESLIYAWFDDGTIYWWSDANDVYLNKNCYYMFGYFYGLKNIDTLSLKADNVEDMSYMFYYSNGLQELDISSWNSKYLYDTQYMFAYCTSLTNLNITGFNTQKVNNMQYMFYYCSSLVTIDLSYLDTRNLINMRYMFANCTSLVSLDLSHFNTGKLTDAYYMFNNDSKLAELNMANFIFSKLSYSTFNNFGSGFQSSLKKLNLANAKFGSTMSAEFSGLTALQEIDLSNADTSLVTDMSYLFSNCSSLTSLDLRSFDTSNVTSMSYMFRGCSSLTSINMSSFNTMNVQSMSYMFQGCSSITSLDLSNFNTNKLTSLSAMFNNCTNLTELNLSNWNFKSISNSSLLSYMYIPTTLRILVMDNVKFNTSMSSLFSNYSLLEQLSLNNVTTSDVTSMNGLFSNCTSLTNLDLRAFNTSKITDMTNMFYGMTSLESITVSDDFVTDNVESSNNMFYNDTNLVGGAGTVFDSNHIDKEYARYDGGQSRPGYFNDAYNEGKYEIKYVNGNEVFKKYIDAGDSVEYLPELSKEGYTFLGWYLNDSKITADYVPLSNIVIVARFTANKQTITFETNGGSEINPILVDYDSEIGELPSSYKDGYRLIGWYDTPTFETKIVPSRIVKGDLTVYAKWEETYSKSIVYNANGGSFLDGTTRTIKYDYKSDIIKTEIVHTPNIDDDGYASSTYEHNMSDTNTVYIEGAQKLTIEVWYTTNSSEWLAIYPKGVTPTSTNYNSATISHGKLSGYGGYRAYVRPDDTDATYHKVYEVDGDTAQFYFQSSASGAGYYGYYAKVTGKTYSRDKEYEIPKINGKKFVGWNTEPDGTGTSYLDEDEVLMNILDIDNPLYAQYIDGYATFIDGKSLNARMKKLSGTTNATHTSSNSNIRSIVRSNSLPSTQMTDDNIVSTPDSIIPIYMWYENNSIKYYVDSNKVYFNFDSSYAFYYLTNLQSIDFTGINTSKVENFNYFVSSCSYLTSLDLSSFNTTSAKYMSHMFYSCNSLTSLNVSSFNTSKVIDMSYMFSNCANLTELNLSSFNTSKVTKMNYMFYYCKGLTSLNLNTFNTSNVTDMTYMFCYCNGLTSLNVSSFNIEKVITIDGMFSDCSSLTTLDLTSFNPKNAYYMGSMFANCTSLTNIKFNNFDTSKAVSFSNLFKDCSSLKKINLSSFKTSNVQSMSYMFSGCTSLTELDLSLFNTSNVISMSYMFNGCESLIELDLFYFDVQSVTDMSYMFSGCTNLVDLGLNSFNTIKVTNMNNMFKNCSSLVNLDLSSFNTSKVNYMPYMFDGCTNLTELDISSFKTNNVSDMKYMFRNCISLKELDLSHFNTSKVNYMQYMFYGCTSIQEIDISGFTSTRLNNVNYMFANCTDLRTIYSDASITFAGITNATNIFNNDDLLVGGRGTPYSSANIDKQYAHLDGGTTNPGYFSQRKGVIIFFDANGGTITPDMRSINVGAAIGTLPTPTRDGATFEGWYDDLEYSNKILNTTKFYEDTTIYAKWNVTKYTVNFDSQGGSTVPSKQIEHGAYVGELETPTYGTKNFVGWFTSSGDLVHEETKVKSNVTYYAQWTDNDSDAIIYDGNGGVFDQNSETKTINYSLVQKGVKKVSHTSNINDSGVASSVYSDGLAVNDVVTIPYAKKIRIEVWYSTQSSSYDWLAIYPKGVTPTNNNYSSAKISNGKLGGHGSYVGYTQPRDTDSTYHKVYYVNGDTAQFYFRSSSGSGFYGYYAVVTGIESTVNQDKSYEEPIYKYKDFIGWNTKADGTGTSYMDEDSIIADFDSLKGKSLYAQWLTSESTFLYYYSFRTELANLASNDTIIHFTRSETKPDLDLIGNYKIISTTDSVSPIYAWFDDGTVYWYTNAEHPQLNADCTYMFSQFSNIESIDLSTVRSDNPTNLSYMFNYNNKLKTVDISSFNNTKVTSMYRMFYNCTSLETINFGSFNTSNVTSMQEMFYKCYALKTIDLSSFDTSNVTNMADMFNSCYSLTELDLSNWTTGVNANLSGMFAGCSSLESINLNNFNTSNVINMSSMFSNCRSLTSLDLKSFNIIKVTSTASMFNGCSSLERIDGYIFDFASATSMNQMFSGCTNLVDLNISLINARETTTINQMFSGCSSMEYINLELLNLEKVQNITYLFSGCTNLKKIIMRNLRFDNVTSSSGIFSSCTSLEYLDVSSVNLGKITDALKNIPSVKTIIANNAILAQNSSGQFANIKTLEYIEMKNIDASNTTTMASMFSGCTRLKEVNLSDIDLSNVTSMNKMFYECTNLLSVNFDNTNTSNVTDMSYMFYKCSALRELDLAALNTSSVTNMTYMFFSCLSLEKLDISTFDTSNVTNMSYMFYNCERIKVIDVYSFNTSNVQNMVFMFAYCDDLVTIYASTRWSNTLAKSKSQINRIFYYSPNIIGKNGSTWSNCSMNPYSSETSDGTYARLDGSYRGFLTEKNGWVLVNRAYLGIPSKPSEFLDEQQWSYFEDGVPIHSGFRMLNNLKNVEQKFYFENDIAHTGWLVYEGDRYYFSKSDENNNGYTDSWAYRSVTKTIDGKAYTFDSEGRVTNYSSDTYTITFNSNGGTPATFTKDIIKGQNLGNLPIPTRSNKKLEGWYTGIDLGTKISESTIPDGDLTYYAKWVDDIAELDTGKNVNVKLKKLARNTSVSYTTEDKQIYYFRRAKSLPDFEFTDKNIISSSTSSVKIYAWFDRGSIYWWSDSPKIRLNQDSSYLFYNFKAIEEIDATDFDTSQVTNMSYMFYYCEKLEAMDVSGFVTNNVTTMSYMFYYCYSLNILDVSNFNTSNVTDMSYMFYYCSSINELDVSSFNTDNVTTMESMFYSLKVSYLDVSHFNTTKVTNMRGMFSSCSNVKNLDVSHFDTSNVTNMLGMFNGCGSPNLDFSLWDTSNVTNMQAMFANYKYELDLSHFNTSKVTTMLSMFMDYGYESLDLSSFNTSRVTTMETMFYGCRATSINLSSFDTSNVTTMRWMFYETRVPNLDLTMFNTSNVTNMERMFASSSSKSVDLSSFNTSRVTTMEEMFEYTYFEKIDLRSFSSNRLNTVEEMFYGSKTKSIVFGNNFTLSNASILKAMFDSCQSLTELDLSMFTTNNATDMSIMFYGCKSLVSLNISNFNTSRVTNMDSMFAYCSSLTSLSIRNFNTSRVTKMSAMFINCESLKNLDISSFNTSRVTRMSSLFSGMKNVTTIYASSSFTVSSIESGYDNNLFYNCLNLVGEKGTVYDSTKTNKAYAHIDGGTSNPGYFSQLTSAVTISFAANGGTGYMPNQVFSSNLDTILYKNEYTKKFNEFVNWNTEPDGTGTSYPDEGLIPANTFTSDTTLYAQWRLNGWVLINEDQVQPPEDHLEEQLWSYYDHGELIDDGLFILKNFYDEDKIYYIHNGIAQLGWHKVEGNWYYFSKVDTDGNKYVNCDAYENGKYKIGDDTYTFDENGVCLDYAESPSTTYRITLDSNGGGSVRNLVVNRGSGLTNIPTPPAPVGKTFAGWYTGLTDGVKVEEGYVPSGNITIFARYNDIDYEVSFDSREGSTVSSRYKHYGDEVGTLPTTTRSGYTFVGWYTDTTAKTEVTSETKIVDNVTFYARWSKVVSNSCSGNQNISTSSGTICKRATTLHQEECQRFGGSSRTFCESRGYYPEGNKGTFTINYGNCGESGVLTTGDAFDCDVNGDGTFDSSTERFYYVSNFYDTNKEKIDYNTATLIYYTDYSEGLPNETLSYLHDNYNIVNKLPSIYEWPNVSLKNKIRKTANEYGVTKTQGVDNVSVDYTGRAARFLTAVEFYNGCTSSVFTPEYCDFFGEHTYYSKYYSGIANGYWLEGYAQNNNYYYYYIGGNSINKSTSGRYGIRPVIDVDKKKIAYGAEYIDVTYDANGGTGTTDSQNMNKHEEFTLSKSGFSKKNYKFNGWNTSADGTGTSFTDEQLVEGNTFTVNTKLYAQWIKDGWEFENESTWDSTQPLTDQKWTFYVNGTKVLNKLIEVKELDDDNKQNYYYIKDGYLYYGWIQINENWYFFSWFDKDESGHIDGYMVRNETIEIDGVDYTFDTYGVCQNPPSETDLTDSVESPEEVNPLDDSMNIDSSNEEPDIVPESSDGNVIIPEQDPESPDSNSNVGSSVFGLLYKYDLEHKSQGIILIVSMAVLSALFGIYMFINRKKRINY